MTTATGRTPPLPAFLVQRLTQDEYATFGQLVDAEGHRIAVTLELPWRNNQHGESCIPCGHYTAHRRFSPRHRREVFQIDDVPGRDDIEIHIANWPHELLGCLAPGTSLGTPNGQRGIVGSRVAFEAFMGFCDGHDVIAIEVRDPFPQATRS